MGKCILQNICQHFFVFQNLLSGLVIAKAFLILNECMFQSKSSHDCFILLCHVLSSVGQRTDHDIKSMWLFHYNTTFSKQIQCPAATLSFSAVFLLHSGFTLEDWSSCEYTDYPWRIREVEVSEGYFQSKSIIAYQGIKDKNILIYGKCANQTN